MKTKNSKGYLKTEVVLVYENGELVKEEKCCKIQDKKNNSERSVVFEKFVQFYVCSYKHGGRNFRIKINIYKEGPQEDELVCVVTSRPFAIKAKKPIANPGSKKKRKRACNTKKTTSKKRKLAEKKGKKVSKKQKQRMVVPTFVPINHLDLPIPMQKPPTQSPDPYLLGQTFDSYDLGTNFGSNIGSNIENNIGNSLFDYEFSYNHLIPKTEKVYTPLLGNKIQPITGNNIFNIEFNYSCEENFFDFNENDDFELEDWKSINFYQEM